MAFSPKKLIYDLALVIWPPVAVLTLHVTRVFYLGYYNQLDVLAHFLGGLSIAWSAKNAYELLRARGFVPALPRSLKAYLFVTTAISVGVFWEMYEWVWFHNRTLATQLSWWTDSIGDLTMDTLGALLFVLIATRKRA